MKCKDEAGCVLHFRFCLKIRMTLELYGTEESAQPRFSYTNNIYDQFIVGFVEYPYTRPLKINFVV